jgi:hypothetical protein
MQPRYTAIWQAENPIQREWIDEIFGPYIGDRIYDGKREVVLDNCILFDSFTYCRDPAYYARFKAKNAFLVHFYDEFYEGGNYQLYENFRGVFRNFWSDVFNTDLVMTLPLGYTIGTRLDGAIPPLQSRRFIWTLLGECNKSSRPDAVRALSHIEPHFFYSTDRVPGFTGSAGRAVGGFDKKEYRELLLDSMFVPSPMGNANIECYRTFEALECGAIPVVERRLTLDYYSKLLGSDFPGLIVGNWREARNRINDLLQRPDELHFLQGRCLEWWGTFKKSYSAQVGAFMEERSRAGRTSLNPICAKRTCLPLWREVELIRHHSPRALYRRIIRQFSRLVREKRWRVAYHPEVQGRHKRAA